MQLKESNKVHLDHLINRLSIRYSPSENAISPPAVNRMNDPHIRYNDIKGDWFSRLRKPDFQRETNAWSPFQCREFIESVYLAQIVPSIILWKSDENGTVYILDGAHRLSVLKAWFSDDWGDKAGDYYERRDFAEIKRIAENTRLLINSTIGSFEDFRTANQVMNSLILDGKAPKQEMSEKEFRQAQFYGEVINSNSSLYAQWELGNYEVAEQSFLRINRQGQALDPWEATLIEYRQGSYSRTIMHIANGGESGHYWPSSHNLNPEHNQVLSTFATKAQAIYQKLFVPTFALPIRELTVPILVAPAYFQKHIYLLEIIPLLVWNKIATDEDDQIQLLQADYRDEMQKVIDNGCNILNTLNSRLEHIVSFESNALSLSLVPLIYWYNHRGEFVRSLLYGFLYWIFAGSDKEIFNRKIVFSIHRSKVESVLFYYKQEIAALAALAGAGLKATRIIADFYEQLLFYFNENQNVVFESDELEDKILQLTRQKRQSKSLMRTGRNFTKRDQSQSNINELYSSSIKCGICNGIANLKYGGIQYDHIKEYKLVQVTDPENMRPTHPFCNNNREKIEEGKGTKVEYNVRINRPDNTSNEKSIGQLSFWGDDVYFPQ